MENLEPTFLSEDELGIPDKCRGCAVQCDISADHYLLSECMRKLEDDGVKLMEMDVEELDITVISDNEELSDQPVTKEVREKVAAKKRQEIADELNEAGEEKDRFVHESKLHSEACDGALEIIAERAGKRYIAVLCTSTWVDTDEAGMFREERHIPMHVKILDIEHGEEIVSSDHQ